MVTPNEVVLERQSTFGREELSGDGIVSDGQQRDCNVEVLGELFGNPRLGRPLAQTFTAVQVRCEVAIA
jgi:hypothetical protein